MSDFETSVETQEVAEPAIDTGAETQEVAEPVIEGESAHKNTPDEAFAEMRRAREEADRRAEEAERELAELKAESNARAEVMRRLTGSENADINALAESIGTSADDLLATMDSEKAVAMKDLEIERLQSELNEAKAEQAMQKDLSVLQAIDPSIKSAADLGSDYVDYIKAGLSAEQAYYAVKGKEISTKVTPPKEVGKVNNEPPEKDFFTEAEVDAMTEEQQRANADKIVNSMAKW